MVCMNISPEHRTQSLHLFIITFSPQVGVLTGVYTYSHITAHINTSDIKRQPFCIHLLRECQHNSFPAILSAQKTKRTYVYRSFSDAKHLKRGLFAAMSPFVWVGASASIPPQGTLTKQTHTPLSITRNNNVRHTRVIALAHARVRWRTQWAPLCVYMVYSRADESSANTYSPRI